MTVARARRRSGLPESVQKVLGGVESGPEALLLSRITWNRLPEPKTQVKLIPDRKYRYDAVWPDWKLAVEVQGGTWASGRHTRGTGYESDAVKSALAQIQGFIVIYVTPGMVDSGVACHLIREALISRGWKP